jgi:3-oxoacyl-[acyl-carrier-protein] synthase-1
LIIEGTLQHNVAPTKGEKVLNILAYGCTSSAGPTVTDFFDGLRDGKDHSQMFEDPHLSRICRWQTGLQNLSSLEKITTQLLLAWNQIKDQKIDISELGIIFASTKGCIEDFFNGQTVTSDPLTPILDLFIKKSELKATLSICVSNACSSTLAALFLAEQWILQKRAKSVLVLSADEIGPFVNRGFYSLKALSQTKSQPFGAHRDGLQLGEAASAILLGESESAEIEIIGVGIDTEGFAIARPSHSGDSLFKSCEMAIHAHTPDLIIAHGTGTVANDEVEDQVLSRLFQKKHVPITSTKWSIGHTLGASASMDLIAACEVLRTQNVFSISNTEEIDLKFQCHYLNGKKMVRQFQVEQILLTSLGFGGVHGAAFLKRVHH